MADKTEISWTDSSFNIWWGCSPVGPGCDHCYAAALGKRFGAKHWGKSSSPRILSNSNWLNPPRWQRRAEKSGIVHKVFCGSMCDWADKNGPERERERLWGLICETPMLHWQLLTKRAHNIAKFLPNDWGLGYKNVWLGVTVENRKHGLRRLEVLREIPARIRFLSVEPLLEDLGDLDLSSIDWVIVGGESGPHARKMSSAWVRRIKSQCREQGVPFFFKQWGGNDKSKGGCLLNGREVKEWPIKLQASHHRLI